MPPKTNDEAQVMLTEMIKNETDPEKIKSLSELSETIKTSSESEKKLIEANSKLLADYKASILHEGSDKKPESPVKGAEPKTFNEILAEISAEKE